VCETSNKAIFRDKGSSYLNEAGSHSEVRVNMSAVSPGNIGGSIEGKTQRQVGVVSKAKRYKPLLRLFTHVFGKDHQR